MDIKSSEDDEPVPEDSDSCFGSISEGHNSLLVQPVPVFGEPAATKLPQQRQETSASELWLAVLSNDPQRCRDLLDSAQEDAPGVNAKTPEGLGALHLASRHGLLEVCEVLVDYGREVDVNVRSPSQQTPLHLASLHGHLRVAQFLVRCGAQVNSLDLNNNTPLHLMVRTGNLEMLLWFMTRNPDLNIENKDRLTPLALAPTEEVRTLLQKHGSAPPSPSWGEPRKITINGVGPDDFEVLQILGKGSFGEVFLVKKKATSELFAMKVLRKERVMQQNLIRYALTERNVLSYIRHPFIVGLSYAFQTRDKLFLVLDYCPGQDLSQHLRRVGRFDEPTAKHYLCEVLLAIEALHSRDIIFRDLKPENVVLDADGHAMLTDFGLSKEGVLDNVTTKTLCGSLAYLAPEMLLRKGHGKTVDWYLLGVLFYELLVGRPPFFSSNKEELLANIKAGKLKVTKNVSMPARDLLKDLLKRDPSLRLGARRDAAEVKEHSYFRGVNWQRVLRRELPVKRPQLTPIGGARMDVREVFGDLTTPATPETQVTGWSFAIDET